MIYRDRIYPGFKHTPLVGSRVEGYIPFEGLSVVVFDATRSEVVELPERHLPAKNERILYEKRIESKNIRQ